MSRWKFALTHLVPSLWGLLRTLLRHPVFALKLLVARATYFITRNFNQQLATPDGFHIKSFRELISYWSFFIERESWSPEWVDLIRSEQRPVVFDIGANAGLFTHLVWTLNPNAEIFAFEPLNQMAEQIARWQQRTKANAVLFNTALADHTGTASFYASSPDDTTATLKPLPATVSVKVPVSRLDDLVKDERPICLIKIDVEGSEPEVLAGAKQTLDRTRFLIVEAHTRSAFKAIEAELGPEWNAKRVGASDYLFFRNQ